MTSPYDNLPLTAFWRSGVGSTPPDEMYGIYRKKWGLGTDLKVATAGSCFAQHISRYMRKNGFSVMDVEHAPADIEVDKHEKYGYGLYSARYGNIYTVHQLLQLGQEVVGDFIPQDIVWEREGRFYDAIRPSIQPGGFLSRELLLEARELHLACVRELFLSMDVLVFTLGLTEAWLHRESGTVFPTAPETIAGHFDPLKYEFKNYNAFEVAQAFIEFLSLMRKFRVGKPELKVLLTVSPVPLTATASGKHILQSSIYSKAVLRSVAGFLADNHIDIDYFPSFEIITNPAAKSKFYNGNLRTVTSDGVAAVMKVFFGEHDVAQRDMSESSPRRSVTLSEQDKCAEASDEVQCEEVLLESFGQERINHASDNKQLVVFVGDSHLSGVKECVNKYFNNYRERYRFEFVPTSWMSAPLIDMQAHKYLTSFDIKAEYAALLPSIPTPEEMKSGAHVCFVGLGVLGDGVIRAHGAMTPGSVTEAGIIGAENPIIPVISNKEEIKDVKDGKKTIEEISDFEIIKLKYVHNLNVRINIYTKIFHSAIYSSVRWIASPNMVESTARFRFGDEYVESQSHFLHTRIAGSYIQKHVGTQSDGGWLILHSSDQEGPNGFTKNEFAFNSNVNDIHTNAEFYKSSVQRYLNSIA